MRTCTLIVLGGIAMSASAEITVDGSIVSVTTATLVARFDGAALTSLSPVGASNEFIHALVPATPIDLVYLNGERRGQDKHQTTEVRRISPHAARIDVRGADSNRSLLVRVDPTNGDLCLTPDGLSTRRGVRAVRWSVAFDPECDLILPCVNGLLVRSATAYPGGERFEWPYRWNVQLAIAQRGAYSMMVHTEDPLLRFKALALAREGDRSELGFDSEVPGPAWGQQTAGGIEWRISVSAGDWRVPAARYRDWMRTAYDLDRKRAARPAWTDRISLAVCWAHPVPAMLDALAAVHPPQEILIHLAEWRTDKYDVNYPDYIPTENAAAYIEQANAMGFHVMPHFNYFAAYYDHPFFQEVREFQIRSVDKNEPQGWHWPPETHDYTRMGYIHPGLGLWRRKLIDVVLEACTRVGTDTAFIDQTLCTWNTDNGLVQGLTTAQGLSALQEEFAAVRPELVLAGEGLNEVSFAREAFAQAHIHNGWGDLSDDHVEAAHPICSFLWEGHTRLVGYYHHLNPDNANVDRCIEVYRRMGAIPTLVTNKPAHLQEPGEAVKRVLQLAREESGKR